MSVTFAAVPGPVMGFVVACCDGAARLALRHASYEDAEESRRTVNAQRTQSLPDPLPGCEWPDQCPEYPLSVRPVEDNPGPEVNVSNTNAAILLDVLGFPADDLCGEVPADEFLHRVITTLVLAPDDVGIPTRQISDRLIVGGRSAGYIQDRLTQLHDLAQWCIEHNRSVYWV